MFSKFGTWDAFWYRSSDHPENVAIRNIISQNHQNNFIVLGDGKKTCQFHADGVNFYNFGIDTMPSYLLSFLLKFQLASIIRPSVIVSFGATNSIPLGLSSILTGSKFIPVIAGEVSYAIESVPKYFRKIFAFLLKIMFSKSYRILTLGKTVSKDLINNYGINPEKILIYNYKISEMFNPKVTSNLKELLNPTGPIVLTICRISPEKGLTYLIEASRTITEKIPNVKIIIKGSSGIYASSKEKKYLGELKNLISKYNLQKNIAILKTSYHYEIPKYLAAADVFVLPSLSEGFPLAILEALATGVPVVATPVGGIPDVLVNETNALLVEPRDVEALAEAIVRILTDDKLRKRLIENGLKPIQCIKEHEIETLLRDFLFETKDSKV